MENLTTQKEYLELQCKLAMNFNPENKTEKKALNKIVRAINNLYSANQMFVSCIDKVEIEVAIDSLVKTVYNSEYLVTLVPGKGYKLEKQLPSINHIL